MNNVTPFGPRDEASGLEGDTEFIGVDERTAPQQVAAGFVSSATNKRFRRGRAATRLGITLLPWAKGTGITPFGTPLGALVFNDPNQSGESIIVAAEGKVWWTRTNSVARQVPLPAGVVLTADTFRKFIQANGSIILLRGLNADCLRCDNLETGFTAIAQENIWDVTFDAATNRVGFPSHNLLIGDPVQFNGASLPAAIVAGQTYYVLDTPNVDAFTIAGTPAGAQATWNTSPTDATVSVGKATVLDGAEPIAPAEDGFFLFNRLYLIVGKDLVAESDIGDFTRYQKIPNTFRINQGDSYTLKAIYPFNDDTILFFKSGNVKKAVGVNELATAQGPLNVTESYGGSGPSVADQGADVFWLNSELRLTSLNLTSLNQTQATNFALSDPLVQTFGRINPQYASKARIAIHDGYLRVALPLDEAELLDGNGAVVADGVNTGIAIYDFQARSASAQGRVNQSYLMDSGIAGAWAGVDESPVTCVVDWLKFALWGQTRLGFLGADGHLHLCDDGYDDEVIAPITPYADVLADGYTGGNNAALFLVNGSGCFVSTAATNTANHWGTGANLAQNLWRDANGQGGFDPTATAPFGAPNTTPSQIPGGVRFTSTNGVLPAVTVSGADAALLKLVVDSHDVNQVVSLAIADRVRTRAYLCKREDFKRFTVLAANLATWNPSYTVSTATQGVNTDEVYLADQARNPLKYFTPLDKPDYDPSNGNDDFLAPNREDYSVVLPDPDGAAPGSGIAPDALQEYLDRATVNERGLWVQLQIENASGRLELIATAMEAQAGEVLSGVSMS